MDKSTRKQDEPVVIERRFYALENIEIRAAKDDGPISMTGYAAMFNKRSVMMWDWEYGNYVEEIEAGAFRKTVGEADVRLLINHDPNLILARTRSNTLSLAEDKTGLRVEADMAPTSYGQDLAISMRRGDISQMSFAFRTIKDSWSETEDGMPLRRLEEVALTDASVVTYPAYPDTQASARAIEMRAVMDALGLSDMDDEHRKALIASLTSHEITPDSLPVLRAARTALDARIATAEPHEQHSEEPAGEMYDIRYRALAALHGLGEAVA